QELRVVAHFCMSSLLKRSRSSRLVSGLIHLSVSRTENGIAGLNWLFLGNLSALPLPGADCEDCFEPGIGFHYLFGPTPKPEYHIQQQRNSHRLVLPEAYRY